MVALSRQHSKGLKEDPADQTVEWDQKRPEGSSGPHRPSRRVHTWLNRLLLQKMTNRLAHYIKLQEYSIYKKREKSFFLLRSHQALITHIQTQ